MGVPGKMGTTHPTIPISAHKSAKISNTVIFLFSFLFCTFLKKAAPKTFLRYSPCSYLLLTKLYKYKQVLGLMRGFARWAVQKNAKIVAPSAK
ncbi:MAG: hypothetical protein IIX00_05895, partial [Tidjanibacter sp.]|nr:hypothetical protein [Tidjanibacter sp.]